MADPVTASACLATTFSPWLGINVEFPPGQLAEMLKNPDAIQLAAQTGRFDFLTAILACVGLLVAMGSIAGFWIVRGAAMNAARDEIKNGLPKLLPDHIGDPCRVVLLSNPDIVTEALRKYPDILSKALKNDPSILRSAVGDLKSTLFGDIDDQEAEAIAQKVGG